MFAEQLDIVNTTRNEVVIRDRDKQVLARFRPIQKYKTSVFNPDSVKKIDYILEKQSKCILPVILLNPTYYTAVDLKGNLPKIDEFPAGLPAIIVDEDVGRVLQNNPEIYNGIVIGPDTSADSDASIQDNVSIIFTSHFKIYKK